MKKYLLIILLFQACIHADELKFKPQYNHQKEAAKSSNKKSKNDDEQSILKSMELYSNIIENEKAKGNDPEAILRTLDSLNVERLSEVGRILKDTSNLICICNKHPSSKKDCTRTLLAILRHTGFEWRTIATENKREKLRERVLNYAFLDSRYHYFEDGDEEHQTVRKYSSKFLTRDGEKKNISLKFYSQNGSRDPKHYNIFRYFERKNLKENNGALLDLTFLDEYTPFSFVGFRVERIFYYGPHACLYLEIVNDKTGDLSYFKNEFKRKIELDTWVNNSISNLIEQMNKKKKQHNSISNFDKLNSISKQEISSNLKPSGTHLLSSLVEGIDSETLDKIENEYELMFEKATEGKNIGPIKKFLIKNLGRAALITFFIIIASGATSLAALL